MEGKVLNDKNRLIAYVNENFISKIKPWRVNLVLKRSVFTLLFSAKAFLPKTDVYLLSSASDTRRFQPHNKRAGIIYLSAIALNVSLCLDGQ